MRPSVILLIVAPALVAAFPVDVESVNRVPVRGAEPRLVFDGTSPVVVWVDERFGWVSEPGARALFFKRLSPDAGDSPGSLLYPEAPSEPASFAVATSDGGTLMTVWVSSPDSSRWRVAWGALSRDGMFSQVQESAGSTDELTVHRRRLQ